MNTSREYSLPKTKGLIHFKKEDIRYVNAAERSRKMSSIESNDWE